MMFGLALQCRSLGYSFTPSDLPDSASEPLMGIAKDLPRLDLTYSKSAILENVFSRAPNARFPSITAILHEMSQCYQLGGFLRPCDGKGSGGYCESDYEALSELDGSFQGGGYAELKGSGDSF